jgi:3-hydroxymyristoyl/3-hydroxydecanoyl-(acyl carrier protein) dehydratase
MPAETQTYSCVLRIDADHPALPGHFPHRPIVPGVVLLDEVLKAAEQWQALPLQVRALPQAKFAMPLLPDEAADLELKLQGVELRFAIRRNDAIIAQGMFTLGAQSER